MVVLMKELGVRTTIGNFAWQRWNGHCPLQVRSHERFGGKGFLPWTFPLKILTFEYTYQSSDILQRSQIDQQETDG